MRNYGICEGYSTQLVCMCVCLCYLANSCAVNVQVESKIQIERKCGTEGF